MASGNALTPLAISAVGVACCWPPQNNGIGAVRRFVGGLDKRWQDISCCTEGKKADTISCFVVAMSIFLLEFIARLDD